MIVVRIEVWPHGDKTKALHRGTMVISNVGGSATRGSYTFRVLKHIGKRGVWKSGRVLNFPRSRLGPWDLLFRALQKAVGERNP